MRSLQLLAVALLATAAWADVDIELQINAPPFPLLSCSGADSCLVSTTVDVPPSYPGDPFAGQYPTWASAFTSSTQVSIDFSLPALGGLWPLAYPSIRAAGDFSESVPIQAPPGSYALFNISWPPSAQGICSGLPFGGLALMAQSFSCSSDGTAFMQPIVDNALNVSFSYEAFPAFNGAGDFWWLPISFTFAVQDLQIVDAPDPVPESSTLLLLATAAASAWLMSRRRRMA